MGELQSRSHSWLVGLRVLHGLVKVLQRVLAWMSVRCEPSFGYEFSLAQDDHVLYLLAKLILRSILRHWANAPLYCKGNR